MTEGGLPPVQEKAYDWDESVTLPTDVLQLWTEVGNGIDKSQTVVWKSAVESLDQAHRYLMTAREARFFVEKYMGPIIGILIEQQPSKIGMHERTCVTDSLTLAVIIVARDLQIQIDRLGECLLLPTLTDIFNRKKTFYKGNKGAWTSNHSVGMPEVRLRNIERFRSENGFRLLHQYLLQKNGTSAFPKLEGLQKILQALGDSIPGRMLETDQESLARVREVEDDACSVSKAVMQYISTMSEDTLKKLPTDHLTQVLNDLRRIFDRLIPSRRAAANEFYEFWRDLALKLIASTSLPLKLYGWEQVGDLIEASTDHRPPPRAFLVSGAGCSFVNGLYDFAGEVTKDGYAKQGTEVTYVRKVGNGETEGPGKKLTLFRCTMRSQQKWWFLSEADEEQPGTDRDIDYYQHKTREHEEAFPPPKGWITCRSAGLEPPPSLEPKGVLVPPGMEYNTLEHQLARWAIDNKIVEQVLGDTTIHREVVARSTVLVKFLASMCDRDQPLDVMSDDLEPNKYCLQASHLLFAWKTSTRKADGAVSLQIFQLLVSILPLCPSDLAVPLLKAVQTSLHEKDEHRDYLSEVTEFCSALASSSLVDAKAAAANVLRDDVREEVLNLLWSVLTHPDVLSLKSYDMLKKYVAHELRVEPKGSEYREKFLQSCVDVLSTNARVRAGTSVDEGQALMMVKLTHFVLEACPRQQADKIVGRDSGSLPTLLYLELVAYLERRENNGNLPSFRKPATITQSQVSSASLDLQDHMDALNERLRNLRHVYGLSESNSEERTAMSFDMLERLWSLCDKAEDREALMVFIASSCQAGRVGQYDQLQPLTSNPSSQSESLLSAAFSEQVCHTVFLKLVCSPALSFENFGENGYRSFQVLFSNIRQSSASSNEKRIALDALWRVCLTIGNDYVASQAMKDLLSVYASMRSAEYSFNGGVVGQNMSVENSEEESFARRMFDCLAGVKNDIVRREKSSERSAQRCLRILNTAIGQGDAECATTTTTLARLAQLPPTSSLAEAVKCLPHGMRAQSSYRRIGVVAKFPQVPHQKPGQVSIGGEGVDDSVPRPPSTQKFTLDVHPLETLASLKQKIARYCNCTITAVKPISINGRGAGRGSNVNLNLLPDDTVVDEIGVVQGCEMVFVIAERPVQTNATALTTRLPRVTASNDLTWVFFSDDSKFSDQLFTVLLGILESLPWINEEPEQEKPSVQGIVDTSKLVWDLLLAMPTNPSIAARVRGTRARPGDEASAMSEDDAMDVDSTGEPWSQMLDGSLFDRSVYVLLTIDAFLKPAPEALSILNVEQRQLLEERLSQEAADFRRLFIEGGGFFAVVRFFSMLGSTEMKRRSRTRRGNAVALRVLKSCLFRSSSASEVEDLEPDESGLRLLQSLSDGSGLQRSLVAMVVADRGLSSSTVSDVLKFLKLLFRSPKSAENFVSLPDFERFLFVVLLWDEGPQETRTSSSVNASVNVRKSALDLILRTPRIADSALPSLLKSIDQIEVSSDSTAEFFSVLEQLVVHKGTDARTKGASDSELRELGRIICKKLLACPRPNSEMDLLDINTGVLCGCLTLLRALIDEGGGEVVKSGASLLLSDLPVDKWSETSVSGSSGVLAIVSSTFGSRLRRGDATLMDVIGAIFDGFLCPSAASSVAICCDKDSRRRGFEVVLAAVKACKGGEAYIALSNRLGSLISNVSPRLRHRWGQFGGNGELHSRHKGSSKYSGLRNQGCTCYMNSVLQQLFMMPDLRTSMCSAPLPKALRSSGSGTTLKGAELVGKKISMQWETGVSYDAVVESYNETTGMHTIRYCTIQVAVGAAAHNQVQPEDIARLPPNQPDEFVLSDGRPGKETGAFELITEGMDVEPAEKFVESADVIKETEDELTSRHLLQEVQRTFIHLEEGSRGRCFDPRVLVEACACLKLEFDVWQQNDASEFATKLLDRLEISLKRWAPSHFRYMDHTFGIKQIKQKICKECGLKSNREEKLLNIDCQIRGKSDINEALAAMTEIEIMEGSNKVFCDNCKRNTDTVLKTAISSLPNVLILSLKRFDLDFNTFETVKLNSRCAFGQTLNMKQYTLEGLEALERNEKETDQEGEPSAMDTDDKVDASVSNPLDSLPDEDFEYRLVGVLVHAGVAQGGHYYSFIKDRSPGGEEKWYRFDDEEVTPFDPALIESECFGGKVKKETKWPNGQVHTVEQEQFANALMLFYEKVKSTALPSEGDAAPGSLDVQFRDVEKLTGYQVFEPDVLSANAMHKWQSFLFDSEFQAFLKGILETCLHPESPLSSWHSTMITLLLSYFFDVMLYASELGTLPEWTRLLEEILLKDKQSARDFVHKIARKTTEVSGNWLRVFLLDCPDQGVRASSVRIFSAGIRTAVTYAEEMKLLETWSEAWREQLEEMGVENAAMKDEPKVIPCILQGRWNGLEDTNRLEDGSSSLGIIVSFLNVLLEAIPRCWRFCSEACLLIRNLATMGSDNGDFPFRKALINALIPARIIALAARDRAPALLRVSFPGSSASAEVAVTQVRAESNSNSVLPLSANQVMNSSDLNSSRGPTGADIVVLLEAIASIAGLPGATHATLVCETDEATRNRQRFSLSSGASEALSTIFYECCSEAPGMGQREIEEYLRRCGVDTGSVSTQKILDMLSKHPVTGTTDTKANSYLSLDGFLAYYRDGVQSNDMRLRLDLHTFGFRPDLSRRSRETRFLTTGDRESERTPPESVALDVAQSLGERSLDIGTLANVGLASTVHLYLLAYTFSEPLMQYLVAGAIYRKDIESLTNRTLQVIYQTQNDWGGTEQIQGASIMLQVIASVPGEDQNARINLIMQSTAKASRSVDYGCGLLQVLKAFHRARQQHYHNDYHWTLQRYMAIIKELNNIYAVYLWLNDNRKLWSFIESDLSDSRSGSPQAQMRGDYGGREADPVLPLDQNTHSDSDMAGMNDSEEDDEDSNFENVDNFSSGANDGPYQIMVTGAGNDAVNGTYRQDGYFENACRYVREGVWNKNRFKFFIFQCNVSNNTKHWYISIVPHTGNPGTSSDIDFYTAPMTADCKRVPPKVGWVKAHEGLDPAPTLEHHSRPDNGRERTWQGRTMAERNEGGRSTII